MCWVRIVLPGAVPSPKECEGEGATHWEERLRSFAHFVTCTFLLPTDIASASTEPDHLRHHGRSTSRDNLSTEPGYVASLGAGGLSGKPLRARATEVIRYLHRKSDGGLPIIGSGGIHSAADAREKLEAGAALIQLYTGFIYEGPALVSRINRRLVPA